MERRRLERRADSRNGAPFLAILLAAGFVTGSLGCGGGSASSPPPPPPSGSGVITFAFGPEETVFNHTSDSCEPLDVPDTPAHAVRLPDNSLMLEDGDAPRNYTMFGADFSTLHRSCVAAILVSDDLTTADTFDNQERPRDRTRRLVSIIGRAVRKGIASSLAHLEAPAILRGIPRSLTCVPVQKRLACGHWRFAVLA